MNDVDKDIASTIASAHLFFSLRHFGYDDKSQIYYTQMLNKPTHFARRIGGFLDWTRGIQQIIKFVN